MKGNGKNEIERKHNKLTKKKGKKKEEKKELQNKRKNNKNERLVEPGIIKSHFPGKQNLNFKIQQNKIKNPFFQIGN